MREKNHSSRYAVTYCTPERMLMKTLQEPEQGRVKEKVSSLKLHVFSRLRKCLWLGVGLPSWTLLPLICLDHFFYPQTKPFS